MSLEVSQVSLAPVLLQGADESGDSRIFRNSGLREKPRNFDFLKYCQIWQMGFKCGPLPRLYHCHTRVELCPLREHTHDLWPLRFRPTDCTCSPMNVTRKREVEGLNFEFHSTEDFSNIAGNLSLWTGALQLEQLHRGFRKELKLI
jgi:hypothetical protein